jgi:hypothetical protein
VVESTFQAIIFIKLICSSYRYLSQEEVLLVMLLGELNKKMNCTYVEGSHTLIIQCSAFLQLIPLQPKEYACWWMADMPDSVA